MDNFNSFQDKTCGVRSRISVVFDLVFSQISSNNKFVKIQNSIKLNNLINCACNIANNIGDLGSRL